MIKRILSFLLSLIMMVGVFSLAAFADPTSYDLYVNGELITSEKLTVKCGEGTATYDPAEKTLTLNNAEITKSNDDANNYGIFAESSDVLNIKLIGNNKINPPENGGITVNDTEPIMLVYEIPFVKEVKLGGNTAPGKEIFELEIFDIGNGNAEAYKDVTVMAEVETNGAKKYNGKIVFSGPKYQFKELVCEGFYVREKNGGKAGWKYSDQAYHILMESGEDGEYSENIIQPVKAVMTPNGIFYEPFGEAVKEMNFVNIYTVNRNFTTIHIENPNRKPDEKNPNTGAEVSIAPAVLVPKKHR